MRIPVVLVLAFATLAAGCLGSPPASEALPPEPRAPTGNESASAESANVLPPPPPRRCEAPYDCTDARRDDAALPSLERFEKKVRLSGLDTEGSLDFAPSHPWRAYRIEAWTETAGEGVHESRTLTLYRPYALLLARAEGVGRLVVAANSTTLAGDDAPFRLRVAARAPVATAEMLTLVAEVRYADAPAPFSRLAQGNGYVGFRGVDDHDFALWDAAEALAVRVTVTDDARLLAPGHAFALVGPDGEVAATLGPWGGEMRLARPGPGLWTLRATGGNDPTGGATFGFDVLALLPAPPAVSLPVHEPDPAG